MLPPALAQALRTTAADNQVTVATVVQAAWAVVLSSYTGHPDVVLGCPSSGRPIDVTDAERIIGVFASTLPLRTRKYPITVNSDRGSAISNNVRRGCGITNILPFLDIKKWVGAPGQQLFQSILSLENYPSVVDTGGTAETLSFRREGFTTRSTILSASP